MSDRDEILVIDDEQVVLDAVAKVCAAHGLQLDMAQDAVQGLKMIEESAYRLILCDIRMPDVDGFQFLEAALKRDPLTPVIMTTGYATIEHAVRSLGSGAVGYLPKPFTEDELLSSLVRGLRFADLKPPDRIPRFGWTKLPLGLPPSESRAYVLGTVSWLCTAQAGTALVGVADVFLKTLNTVTKVQLMQGEEEIVQGTPCARLIADDELAHEVFGPVSGRILEVNERLVPEVDLLTEDPFGAGWLYRIVPRNMSYEVTHLQRVSQEGLHEPTGAPAPRPADRT